MIQIFKNDISNLTIPGRFKDILELLYSKYGLPVSVTFGKGEYKTTILFGFNGPLRDQINITLEYFNENPQ